MLRSLVNQLYTTLLTSSAYTYTIFDIRIKLILLTKITPARNGVAHSYHIVRGLYVMAVIFEATIVTYASNTETSFLEKYPNDDTVDRFSVMILYDSFQLLKDTLQICAMYFILYAIRYYYTVHYTDTVHDTQLYLLFDY